VDAHPRAIPESTASAEAAAIALPMAPIDRLATDGSGVEWRSADEVVVAGFADATLWLVRAPVDDAMVERAFDRAALAVEGRAVERGVVRLWGTVDGVRTQVATLGRRGMALEQGRFGPLRVATYFAEGRLRRSPSALRATPLADVARRLGDPNAPLRVFAPGPFMGAAAGAIGGLLAGATAFGGRFVPRASEVEAQVVLTGEWGEAWKPAAERFDAFFRVMAEDPFGHLLGLDRPATAERVSGDAEAVELDVSLDAHALSDGLRAATTASLAEILGKTEDPGRAH
jgi:hypothetical protein